MTNDEVKHKVTVTEGSPDTYKYKATCTCGWSAVSNKLEDLQKMSDQYHEAEGQTKDANPN